MNEEFFDFNVVLETNRLILRFIKIEDKEDLFRNITHDKDVLKYFICEYNENIEDFDFEKMISGALAAKRYFFSIVLKESGEAIGMMLNCSLPSKISNSTEVGYAIGKKYWNQGYTTEALSKMIEFMFKKGIHRVEAKHIKENVASGKVMEKCGMSYEGCAVDDVYYQGKYHSLAVYAIINDK